MSGCSSPDSNEPYTNLKLTEIRQAPGGQLALIFDEKRGQPPGQRVFLTDSKEMNRDLNVAMKEMSEDKRFGETFAGGVILHQRKSVDGISPDTFWIQLDPFELTGTWTPPLSEPALPAASVAKSFPTTSNPSELQAGPIQSISLPIASSLTDLRITPVKPEQHFLWQTASGPFETSVSAQPLILSGPHNNLPECAGHVVRGGIFLAAFGGILALEVLASSHGGYPYPYYSYPSY